jgi:hypothetical protein
MKRYKVVGPGKNCVNSKEISLSEIPFYLEANCDVYEISEKQELLLGIVSKKVLIYFAIEFAENTFKKSKAKYNKKIIYYISLGKRWLENDPDVSREISDYSGDIYKLSGDDSFKAIYYAVTSIVIGNMDLTLNSLFKLSINSHMLSHKYRQKRAGQFIVDFLKSGKHLFMV